MGKQFYYEDVLYTVMATVNCSGDESTLDMCAFMSVPPNVSTRNDAGVVCQELGTPASNCTTGNTRLVDGANNLEGRVEICINNAWGTICDSTFSEDEAVIICNSLGLPYNGTYLLLSCTHA